jgi:hypothetical protein
LQLASSWEHGQVSCHSTAAVHATAAAAAAVNAAMATDADAEHIRVWVLAAILFRTEQVAQHKLLVPANCRTCAEVDLKHGGIMCVRSDAGIPWLLKVCANRASHTVMDAAQCLLDVTCADDNSCRKQGCKGMWRGKCCSA